MLVIEGDNSGPDIDNTLLVDKTFRTEFDSVFVFNGSLIEFSRWVSSPDSNRIEGALKRYNIMLCPVSAVMDDNGNNAGKGFIILVSRKFIHNMDMETRITCRYRVYGGLDHTLITDFADTMTPNIYDGRTNEVFSWGFKDVSFASLRGDLDKSKNMCLTLFFTIVELYGNARSQKIDVHQGANCGDLSSDKTISAIQTEMSWEPDVEFMCHDSKSGQTKHLYASSAILARRSPYYKTMFSSCFVEGVPTTKVISKDGSTISSPPQQWRQVVVDDDFNLFHNILYYIYFDYISFAPGLHDLPSELPEVCDVEEVYSVADRFILPDLKKKVLNYLSTHCDVEEFFFRVMTAEGHHKVAADLMYEEYCLENWDKIRSSQSLGSLLQKHDDDEELVYFYQWFGRMMLRNTDRWRASGALYRQRARWSPKFLEGYQDYW